MTSQRKNISQPADWWAAFEEAAQRERKTLSEWIGEQCQAALKKTAREQLSERPPAYRPKATAD